MSKTFKIGSVEYSTTGFVSLLTIGGRNIYQRIGNVFRVFGVSFRVGK